MGVCIIWETSLTWAKLLLSYAGKKIFIENMLQVMIQAYIMIL